MQTTVIQLKVLADEAMPIDENDWCSERQTQAEQKFWETLKTALTQDKDETLFSNDVHANLDQCILNFSNTMAGVGTYEWISEEMIWYALDQLEPYLEKAVITIMEEGTISQQSEAHKKVIMDLAFGEEFMASKNKGSKVTYQED